MFKSIEKVKTALLSHPLILAVALVTIIIVGIALLTSPDTIGKFFGLQRPATETVDGGQESTVESTERPIELRDDERNKFVCVSQLERSWHGRAPHAVLLEFGVTKLPSDGFAIEIQMDGEFLKEDTYLDAPRMKRPKVEMPDFVSMPFEEPFLSGENVFRISCANRSISLKRSFYVYLESDTPIRPDSILFFADLAVALGSVVNENSRAGQSYQKCPQ